MAKGIKWSYCVFGLSLACADSISRACNAGWQVGSVEIGNDTSPALCKCPRAHGLRWMPDHYFTAHTQ